MNLKIILCFFFIVRLKSNVYFDSFFLSFDELNHKNSANKINYAVTGNSKMTHSVASFSLLIFVALEIHLIRNFAIKLENMTDNFNTTTEISLNFYIYCIIGNVSAQSLKRFASVRYFQLRRNK